MAVKRQDAKKLIKKHIFAQKKDGTIVTGQLVAIKGSKLILQQEKGKRVKTKAIIPLVLFDLLAIGTAPYAYGYGYGYGYPGAYPYGGYPYGYPGFF